jgi:HK97 family phage major capsid protein
MRATDQMLAKIAAEIEQQQAFQDKLLEDADRENRDLTDTDLELLTRSRNVIADKQKQVAPIQESRRISSENSEMIAELARFTNETRNKKSAEEVEYRSAGHWVSDYIQSKTGVEAAMARVSQYNEQRAAAHQTTADNAGLLQTPGLAPVLNFIDTARPMTTWLGPRPIPSNQWTRPKVTQHTSVTAQSAEKGELASRKMTIGKVAVTATTLGGYVNVSRQDIDWSQPGIMDLIINDLAGQYAIETENKCVDDLTAGATTGPTLATGALTAAAVATAFWTAAGSVFAACKGQGRVIGVCGTDMLGLYGPLFPPVNPQNAISAGFNAGDFSSGLVGSISGIPMYVSPGMATLTTLILSTAAAEVYEDRIGSLQVVEPSVLGVQVAYAGYFADVIMQATGIQKIVKTP